tara:strand:+ start:582 stop:773 length:192 start_codon:yes stop_codon:yes gene_type:complete
MSQRVYLWAFVIVAFFHIITLSVVVVFIVVGGIFIFIRCFVRKVALLRIKFATNITTNTVARI